MALQKQPISITFNQGVQTKVDPFQLPIGAFSSLTNAVFTKDELFQKRNGYELLVNAPTAATTLCTLNGGLVLLGQTCQSYSEDNDQLINVGNFQPLSTTVMPVNNSIQAQTLFYDGCVASNGLVCTVSYASSGQYQITDSDTGQVLVQPTTIGTAGTFARVTTIGNYFVIVYLDTVAAVDQLRYITIPLNKPTSPSTPVAITTHVSSAGTPCFDITSLNETLYVAVVSADIGGAIRVYAAPQRNLLTGSVPLPATLTGVTYSTYVYPEICVEANNGFPLIWVGVSDLSNIKAFCLNNDLTTNLALTTVLTSTTIDHYTISAASNVLSVFYTVHNFLTYSTSGTGQPNILSNILKKKTVTLAGSVSSATTLLYGIDLLSKAIFSTTLNKTVMLGTYGDRNSGTATDNTNEPTNFLIDSSGNILSRLAQANASGYMDSYFILPQIQELDSTIYVPYLYANQLQAVNKTQGASANAVFAQYGIYLAKFEFTTPTTGLEIGGSLHASGGFLWQYDGKAIVEHNFHVFPEHMFVVGASSGGSITPTQANLFYVACYEWTDNAGFIHRSAPSIPLQLALLTPNATFTGTTHSSKFITGIATSDTATMQPGQHITGTGIPANTYITNVASTSITISNTATNSATETLTLAALSAVIVQVPTLKLTAKTNVRIVVYRWSTTQQTYYQISSVTSPTLNDPTVDMVTITDTYSDAQIVGNNRLYTTGGVLENIAAPGSPTMTLWQSRLFMVDAEDRNLIWFSKPVIEATPVEMTDLQTLYIAPTTGAQGSTGDITALYSMDDKLLIFKKDAIYYITGQGPDITGANNSFSDPIFITGTVGCANPRSIVLTPSGVMFQSDKGIWILGRDLQTNYLGSAVESFTEGNTVTSALCVPGTNQVRFMLDNNTAVMFDYFYQRWSNWSSVNAISSIIYNDLQAYLNTFNEVVVETPNAYKDLSRPVLLSLTTGWINLAGLQGFERFYQMFLLGVYYSPFKLQVELAYDYNPSPSQSVIVTPDNSGGTWGSEADWGTGGPWGGVGNVFEARIFAQKQKCESFQVTIKEMYDPSLGIAPGNGVTLSGLNLIVGAKRGWRTQSSKRSFG